MRNLIKFTDAPIWRTNFALHHRANSLWNFLPFLSISLDILFLNGLQIWEPTSLFQPLIAMTVVKVFAKYWVRFQGEISSNDGN
jgi:hypothetical protein